MSYQRILRGVAATLTWQALGSDGETAAPSDPVTVEVARADGTVVLEAGTTTDGDGSSPRTVALPAEHTQLLDRLTATWTAADDSAATTEVEVVGGYYFTIAEARASDPSLENDTKFTTPALIDARRQVEEEFEAICGVAFVPRFTREITVDRLAWPAVRTLRAVSTWTGQSYEPWTDLSYLVPDDQGVIWGLPRCARYQIDYEHGYDRPPAEIKAAALIRLRDRASVPLRGIPDRATSFSVAEGGTYGLDQAGLSKTGIPDVDAALARHDHRTRVR